MRIHLLRVERVPIAFRRSSLCGAHYQAVSLHEPPRWHLAGSRPTCQERPGLRPA